MNILDLIIGLLRIIGMLFKIGIPILIIALLVKILRNQKNKEE